MQIIRELVVTLILLSVYMQENSCLDRSCPWSIRTLQYVSDCPTTKENVEKAARIKDCEALAEKQSCTEPSKFKYHCVINDMGDSLVEVCAPVYYIHDFCTEFNVKGLRIQPHYGLRCSNMTPPCTDIYLSTSAYLYPKCYDVIRNRTTSLKTETTTAVDVVTDESENIIVYSLVVVVVVVLLVVSLVCLYHRKRLKFSRGLVRKPRKKEEETNDEEAIELLPGENKKAKDDEFSKRSYTDIATFNRGKSLMAMFKRDSGTDLKVKNKQYTKAFLDEFKKLDEYFVETKIFEKAKKYIEKNRFAILIGPPGNGKTNTAIHLMLDPTFASWTKRKVNRLSELALIDQEESTFVLIDNIFDGLMYDEEVGKWLDGLVFKFSNLSKQRNVQLLITAKDDVIESISKYMDRRSEFFDRKYVIDVNNAQLTDSEKLDIFDSQISFAKKEWDIEKPAKNEKFRKEIVNARGPIGFPLCAHLYACAEKNRRKGSTFFSHPMDYLRDLVKYEIDGDKTPKTKTLLLLLYLSSPDIMNLSDDTMCQQSLEKFPSDNEEFDTSGLVAEAEKLIPTILRRPKPDSFCFKHQTICNAVGNYFFVEHFKMAREAFPIETFVDQDFSTVTEQQCSDICVRLIEEVVDNSNVEKVFSCIALKESSFAQTFYGHLDAKDTPFLREFFAATGTHSCQFKFPGTFWVSMNQCFHLAMLLTEMIRIKDIDADLHFYASLFGDCCASDKKLLKDTNPTTLNDANSAKYTVRKCTTRGKNNIFHIVAMTPKSDLHCFDTLKKLHADFQDMQPEMYKSRNKKGETPLNLAAKVTSVSRILSILTFLEIDETCSDTKDDDGHYPIHNTVRALQSRNYNALLELEMTVRVCIFIVYGANSDHQTEAKSLINKGRFKHLHAMLECQSNTQNKMKNIIETLLTEIGKENRGNEEGHHKLPNPKHRIGDSLLSMIKRSVSILMKAQFEI